MADPFHSDGEDDAPGGRPWLFLGGASYPEPGQFLCWALTTTERKASYLLPLGPHDWLEARGKVKGYLER